MAAEVEKLNIERALYEVDEQKICEYFQSGEFWSGHVSPVLLAVATLEVMLRNGPPVHLGNHSEAIQLLEYIHSECPPSDSEIEYIELLVELKIRAVLFELFEEVEITEQVKEEILCKYLGEAQPSTTESPKTVADYWKCKHERARRQLDSVMTSTQWLSFRQTNLFNRERNETYKVGLLEPLNRYLGNVRRSLQLRHTEGPVTTNSVKSEEISTQSDNTSGAEGRGTKRLKTPLAGRIITDKETSDEDNEFPIRRGSHQLETRDKKNQSFPVTSRSPSPSSQDSSGVVVSSERMPLAKRRRLRSSRSPGHTSSSHESSGPTVSLSKRRRLRRREAPRVSPTPSISQEEEVNEETGEQEEHEEKEEASPLVRSADTDSTTQDNTIAEIPRKGGWPRRRKKEALKTHSSRTDRLNLPSTRTNTMTTTSSDDPQYDSANKSLTRRWHHTPRKTSRNLYTSGGSTPKQEVDEMNEKEEEEETDSLPDIQIINSKNGLQANATDEVKSDGDSGSRSDDSSSNSSTTDVSHDEKSDDEYIPGGKIPPRTSTAGRTRRSRRIITNKPSTSRTMKDKREKVEKGQEEEEEKDDEEKEEEKEKDLPDSTVRPTTSGSAQEDYTSSTTAEMITSRLRPRRNKSLQAQPTPAENHSSIVRPGPTGQHPPADIPDDVSTATRDSNRQRQPNIYLRRLETSGAVNTNASPKKPTPVATPVAPSTYREHIKQYTPVKGNSPAIYVGPLISRSSKEDLPMVPNIIAQAIPTNPITPDGHNSTSTTNQGTLVASPGMMYYQLVPIGTSPPGGSGHLSIPVTATDQSTQTPVTKGRGRSRKPLLTPSQNSGSRQTNDEENIRKEPTPKTRGRSRKGKNRRRAESNHGNNDTEWRGDDSSDNETYNLRSSRQTAGARRKLTQVDEGSVYGIQGRKLLTPPANVVMIPPTNQEPFNMRDRLRSRNSQKVSEDKKEEERVAMGTMRGILQEEEEVDEENTIETQLESMTTGEFVVKERDNRRARTQRNRYPSDNRGHPIPPERKNAGVEVSPKLKQSPGGNRSATKTLQGTFDTATSGSDQGKTAKSRHHDTKPVRRKRQRSTTTSEANHMSSSSPRPQVDETDRHEGVIKNNLGHQPRTKKRVVEYKPSNNESSTERRTRSYRPDINSESSTERTRGGRLRRKNESSAERNRADKSNSESSTERTMKRKKSSKTNQEKEKGANVRRRKQITPRRILYQEKFTSQVHFSSHERDKDTSSKLSSVPPGSDDSVENRYINTESIIVGTHGESNSTHLNSNVSPHGEHRGKKTDEGGDITTGHSINSEPHHSLDSQPGHQVVDLVGSVDVEQSQPYSQWDYVAVQTIAEAACSSSRNSQPAIKSKPQQNSVGQQGSDLESDQDMMTYSSDEVSVAHQTRCRTRATTGSSGDKLSVVSESSPGSSSPILTCPALISLDKLRKRVI